MKRRQFISFSVGLGVTAMIPRLAFSTSNQLPVDKVDKSRDFSHDYDDDVFVSELDTMVLQSVWLRLRRLENTIGHGNFNLVSFDEALAYGKNYSAIGEFSMLEKAFIEKIFLTDASDYGFYGKKVTEPYAAPFEKSTFVKIPYTGHYLFKGKSYTYYQKLKKDVGGNIILTSGIRSSIKQLYLFLTKTLRVKGNLSRASRSLAPPGYSYHGIGDFDIGIKGWGAKNFTDAFTTTKEYKRMKELGYVSIRYGQGNQLGVRFEPWHIKVV